MKSSKSWIKSDPQDFQTLGNYVKPFEAKGRTESAALLIWFLRTIYRLDDVEAEDAVCDRKHDEGIDAIFVNDPRREIVLFQSKRTAKLPSTLGDVALKNFFGSLANFKNKKSVENLINTTKNEDLKKLLVDKGIAEKIALKYDVRPVFVTNVAADNNAIKYLPQAKISGHTIDLWDLARVGPVLKQLSREWFIEEKFKLSAKSDKSFVFGAKAHPRIVYAAIKARDLIKLPGIDDLRLFAQNVRLGLGNTRVNNDIVVTLENKNEHSDFITFHNGLTIVSKDVTVSPSGTITLNGFSVCNGCQSLLSMWERRTKLTDDLEILVRIVRVGNDRTIPGLIAYRTNNQNAISLRDLSSNDTAQVHLKNDFDQSFSKFATYTIKRGEKTATPELSNEFAGRLLLSLYAEEPWSSHQKYRIFGDLENRIFSYGINAPQIRLAQLVGESAAGALVNFKYERLAKYGLTQFILVFLMGQILKLNTDGTKLLKSPVTNLSTNAASNPKDAKLIASLDVIGKFVVNELKYFVKENNGDDYDYKTAFKSQGGVETP